MSGEQEQNRSGLKRPAENAEAPQSKRARTDPQPTLTDMPTEVQLRILTDLLAGDSDDPQRALPNIKALAQTNRHLRALVNDEFNGGAVRKGRTPLRASEAVSKLIARVGRGQNAVKRLPYRVSLDMVGEFRSRIKVLNADQIALQPMTDRKPIVRDVIEMPEGVDKVEALHGLVRNVAHIDTEDGILLVDSVRALQRKDGGMELLIRAAIERSSHVQPRELATLARTAIDIESPEARQDCLVAFAGRMGRLESSDQADILAHVGRIDHQRGHSLGAFAAKLPDVRREQRPALVEAVLALPADEPGRMWAMSGLAEHLDLVTGDANQRDQSAAHRVVADILSHGQEQQERVDGDGPWYTEPSLCTTEAIHHLQRHALDDDAKSRTNEIIQSILDAQPPDLARQAQLITHMDADRRTGFAAHALDEAAAEPGSRSHSGTDDDRVVAALTLRMRSLSKDETTAYVSHVCAEDAGLSSLREEILNHNMTIQLDHFQKKERTELVGSRLDAMERHEADDSARIFACIIDNAKLLSFPDLRHTLDVAIRKGARMSRDGEENEIAAAHKITALSAYALADWSSAQLSAIIRRPAKTGDDRHAVPSRNAYDERRRDRTAVR